MATLIGYELQTYRGGTWKIDSVYDDREIAIFEAQRVFESGRCSAVRVVEERYDDESGNTSTKTVFRCSNTDEENASAIERQRTARRELRESRKTGKAADFDFKQRDRRPEKAAASGPGPVALVLILGALLLAGIGAIVGMNYMFGAF